MIRLTEHGRWIGLTEEYGRLYWLLTERGRFVLTSSPQHLVCFPLRLNFVSMPVQPMAMARHEALVGLMSRSRLALQPVVAGRQSLHEVTPGRVSARRRVAGQMPLRRCVWRN